MLEATKRSWMESLQAAEKDMQRAMRLLEEATGEDRVVAKSQLCSSRHRIAMAENELYEIETAMLRSV
jgi:hypothetical protein